LKVIYWFRKGGKIEWGTFLFKNLERSTQIFLLFLIIIQNLLTVKKIGEQNMERRVGFSRIHYEGKMTDLIPAEVWAMATNYLLNPFDYCKIVDYLKKQHGRKQAKIDWATIKKMEVAPSSVCTALGIKSKPTMEVVYLESGKTSNDGEMYYAELNTLFSQGGVNYRIYQEVLIWVSELLSQVVKRKVTLFHDDEKLVEVE